jgi:hypothetical protein
MTAPGTPLEVLFLTPPARAGGALAAQSFVDEEIRAIRDFNVRPYVLTDEISGRTMIDGIPLVGIPRASAAGVSGPTFLGVRHTSLVARLWRASRNAGEIFHALRIEEAAARLIAREHIDVVHSHFGAARHHIEQRHGYSRMMADTAGSLPWTCCRQPLLSPS